MARALLHVLTDPVLARGRSHVEIARAALAGGADVIQLRDKTLDDAGLLEVALAVRALVHAAGRTLVINDRLDVALRTAADGLHLGPADVPLAEARRSWTGLLGASCRTPEAARAAVADGADYLGVGPVFATASKPGLPPAIGLQALARIAGAVPVPVIGIGGIDAANAAGVLRAGAAGVAVISAVVARDDVEAAAREIREAIDSV